MNIWAIADLHLCFGVPNKTMEIFGTDWKNYIEKIKNNWLEKITADDLVLIAGDISWGKNLAEARPDFLFLNALPGIKIIIKGNHDYWWTTQSKLKNFLPSSIHFIHNNVFNFRNISIAGTRLWDSKEYDFSKYIRYVKNPKTSKAPKPIDNEKIFLREIERLKLSLSHLDKNAKIKIAMCHYPPISATLEDSIISKILEKHHIDICVFGHLHHVHKSMKIFGKKNNIKYLLTSSDYLDFMPLKIWTD